MDVPSTTFPKPEIPYAVGRRFTVHSHIPPGPTPVTRGCCLNGIQGREESRAVDPVERCLRYPPLAGSWGSFTVDLEIHDLIRIGDGHNAQLFVVDVLETRSGSKDIQIEKKKKKLVAKVYDPLYFDDHGGYIDPFACVDKHYTHEVHAYHVLAEFQGRLIPRFYGSFSLEIPPCQGGSATRTVRLILIEHIQGLSMRQVDAMRYPQDTRQQIMKTVIEFESAVYEKDVVLTDLSPRNVMVLDNVSDGVVFLDFAGAIFGRKLDEPIPSGVNLFLGQYISPLLRWDRDITFQFGEWIDWEWSGWMKAAFGDTAASITDEMRGAYCP